METVPVTNVLIADDSVKVRRRLRSLLSDISDQRIADVGAGDERVLESVDQLEPEILIIDIQTRSGKGIDLLRRVRAEHPETDVIVLTNKVDRFYRRACLNAGARFFIDKSIEIDRIRDAVAQLWSSPSSSRKA